MLTADCVRFKCEAARLKRPRWDLGARSLRGLAQPWLRPLAGRPLTNVTLKQLQAFVAVAGQSERGGTIRSE